jgi:diketogulonate reductase-like aldo/keto reductase
MSIARNTYSDDTELRTLAQKYKTSTVQLLLRYSLQKGYTPVVKATSSSHLYANMEAGNVVILEEDMNVLDCWDKDTDGSLCLFPYTCPEPSANIIPVPWLINKTEE